MGRSENLPDDARERTEMSSRCEVCTLRRYAEKNPKSLLARLWRWHTSSCPGWKAYQQELTKKQQEEEPTPQT